MKFDLFLEQVLNEAPSTSHGKVESAIRALNLKYKNDRSDKGRAFYLDDGYIVTSMNGGDIILTKRGVKVAKIGAVDVLDATKINAKVEEMLKKNAPELFKDDGEKKKEKDVA